MIKREVLSAICQFQVTEMPKRIESSQIKRHSSPTPESSEKINSKQMHKSISEFVSFQIDLFVINKFLF